MVQVRRGGGGGGGGGGGEGEEGKGEWERGRGKGGRRGGGVGGRGGEGEGEEERGRGEEEGEEEEGRGGEGVERRRGGWRGSRREGFVRAISSFWWCYGLTSYSIKVISIIDFKSADMCPLSLQQLYAHCKAQVLHKLRELVELLFTVDHSGSRATLADARTAYGLLLRATKLQSSLHYKVIAEQVLCCFEDVFIPTVV